MAAAETALGCRDLGRAQRERAEDARAKAVARIAELQAQLAAAKAELQPKLDAVAPAREAAVAAEAARAAAAEAAREVARELEPVSVFISRKTQRLYVRRAFQPVLESPVTILDADRPIGTHVFTALERTNGDAGLRWSVVSLDGGRPHGSVVEPHGRAAAQGRDVGPSVEGRRAREGRARPDRHSAGRVGSYRRDGVAAIVPDRLRRGVELGDRQRHGFRGPPERRAARRPRDPTAPSADRSPLRASTLSPALLALAFSGSQWGAAEHCRNDRAVSELAGLGRGYRGHSRPHYAFPPGNCPGCL